RAHRSHAHRGGPDPARPRRTALGRTGGPREAIRRRVHRLAQRRNACDVQSRAAAWTGLTVEIPLASSKGGARAAPPPGSLGLLDMTPYGRREAWEDNPEGWPEAPDAGSPVGGHGAPICWYWR